MRIATAVFIVAALGSAAIVGVAAVVDADDKALDERPPAEVSVDALVEASPRWFRKPVRVTGRAVPIDDEHFVLRGDERAIVVQPQPATVDGTVERGERVTVTGRLSGFGRLQVAELRRLRESGRHPVLAEAPTELEGVFITADDVAAAG